MKVEPNGVHMWIDAEQGPYCWWCGSPRLVSTPEKCKPDSTMPLWQWSDGSLHGGPES